MVSTCRITALALLVAALSAPATAQLPGLPPSPTPALEMPAGDPYRRETPRSSFLGFISAAQKENWALASEYLQVRGTPPKEAREKLAKEFEAVLDQLFTGDLEKLSRSPLGSLGDGLPADYESAGQLQAGEESVDVLLVRVVPRDGVPIWLVSSQTLRDVPRLAAELTATGIGPSLPDVLNRRLGTLRLWQFAGLLVGFPLLVVLFWLVLRFLGPPVRKLLSGRFAEDAIREATGRLRAPLAFLLAVGAHRLLVFPDLALPLFHRYRYQRTVQVFLVVGVAFLLLRLIDVFMGSIGQRLAAAGATVLPTLSLARRLLAGAVVVLAGLAILALFGVNLTATLAGLGIGGVAVAFAAKASIENIFGGFTVLGEKILRVGDACRIGTVTGTVEDITLFTTRLRTLDRSVVSIPNGTLLTREIENLSSRDRFLFTHILGLRYETTPAQLKAVLSALRKLLADHPRVAPEEARVRFLRLGASSLDLELRAYVLAPDWPGFLEVQEELLFSVLDLVATAGASVAFPSQTVYLGKDVPPGT